MRYFSQAIERYGDSLLDPAIRTHFIRNTGAVYGFIFGLGFAVLLWLPDAIQLQQASAYLAWAKLPIGLVLCSLIGMLVGHLASRTERALLNVSIWIVGGMVIAWVSGHVPYEGVNLIDRLATSGANQHPFYLFAAVLTGISMVIGAFAGFLTGLLHILLIERAWEASSSTNRLTARSILVLCLCLPVAGVSALFVDSQINMPIREPVISVAYAIEHAHDPTTQLVAEGLGFLFPNRNQLTASYTIYWTGVVADPDTQQMVDLVDAVFDTGFILRCQYMQISGSSVVHDCAPIKARP